LNSAERADRWARKGLQTLTSEFRISGRKIVVPASGAAIPGFFLFKPLFGYCRDGLPPGGLVVGDTKFFEGWVTATIVGGVRLVFRFPPSIQLHLPQHLPALTFGPEFDFRAEVFARGDQRILAIGGSGAMVADHSGRYMGIMISVWSP